MRIRTYTRVLDNGEIGLVHDAVIRIVSEVGMRIENAPMLTRLAEAGVQVDMPNQMARLSPAFVERFMADSRPFDWEAYAPRLSTYAPIRMGWYLDPDSGEYLPWTQERLASYAKLARALEHVGGGDVLGCPVDGLPHKLHPLYERYLAWKNGYRDAGSIWDMRLCPYILDMCRVIADVQHRDFRNYAGTIAHFATTLTLRAGEAEQYLYCAERGFPAHLCHMPMAGCTAPVTVAGAAALAIAESLFMDVISRVFTGADTLTLRAITVPMDLRSLMYASARPEAALIAMVVADMARHYRAALVASGSVIDAKQPGAEAGAQRAFNTLSRLMCGGGTDLAAGLLSMDEIGSPLQMILDNEYAGAVKRLIRGCDINEETLGVQVIKEVGPGGLFTDREHTAIHCRSEYWEPRLWSREMFQAWVSQGGKTEIVKARELYHDIMAQPSAPCLPEAADHALQAIIRKADQDLR
ncbi:MAG: hypothetical protein A3K19_23885 [Lentisphaerae bacterium RIFOXYB12_FULL_65_16]|nr:MAG: hypothetical protein A3K18_30730 [Lentisphaerae bacterium RIFOXYA12_64_32]OGV89631.1 MAG: hypothetical protein A3K19_23885 [Lentisphaerae bacterium RIFOXYB12_FULL_65_16]